MLRKALEGIRVIDLTIWQQGPVATALLGDLGAEVIKIEDPAAGDPLRGMKFSLGMPLSLPGGRHAVFEHHDRNKKGMAIDLKKEKGREIIYRLVEKSDVFVQNFRLGVAARLGFDYDALRKINPRLIYANATGFGPRGPKADWPSLDPVGYAETGAMWAVGEPDMPPLPIPAGTADQMGAIMLSYGILAALVARERLGISQEIHSSHIGSMLCLQSGLLARQLLLGRTYARQSRARADNPLFNYYRCQDDCWIFLGLFQSDRYWPDFCRALGIQELEKRPEFQDADARRENSEQVCAILDRAFASRPYAHWEELFRTSYPDFIFAKVKSYGELGDDEQLLANDYIVNFAHPDLGQVKMPGFPVTFEKTPAGIQCAAPHHGQHTEEILLTLCGYSWEDIALLKEEGVIP